MNTSEWIVEKMDDNRGGYSSRNEGRRDAPFSRNEGQRDTPFSKNRIWPDQSKPSFYENINRMFRKYIVRDVEAREKMIRSFTRRTGKLARLSYQKFVAEYMGNSPYRGLLVNHQLGSGKTITGISTMNILKRDTIIMLPAALRESWRQKYIAKYSRHMTPNGKIWNIHYLSYNASNLVAQYNRIEPTIERDINAFDNKFVIIDESHEFIQNVISGKATQAITIFNYLLKAKNLKLLLLTGTPIVGDPYEFAVCATLLRGGLTPKKPSVFRELRSSSAAPPTGGDLTTSRGENRGIFNRRAKIKGQARVIRTLPLFPDMRSEFYKYFVDDNDIKNAEIFKERITGLVSFFGGIQDPNREIIPESSKIKVIKIFMGDLQWSMYSSVRQSEEDMERRFKFLTKEFRVLRFKKPVRSSIGTYKTNSSKVCNFAFPVEVEKIYKIMMTEYLGEISYGKNIPDDTWNAINNRWNWTTTEIRQKSSGFTGTSFSDRTSWPKKLQIAEIKWRIMMNLFKFRTIWKRMDRLSGKLYRLINMIIDNPIKRFVFSRFKVLGTRLIGRMLQVNNFIRIKNEHDYMNSRGPAFMIIDGDTKNKTKLVSLFNREDNKRGEKCQLILGTMVLSKGVSLLNVRETIIYESQWRNTTIEQIIGRSNRLFSHKMLPKSERTVKSYIFISVPPKGVRLTNPTTDELLWNLAIKKQEFNNKFLHVIKEAAVDCKLNLIYNQIPGEREIVCQTCYNPYPGRSLFPADYRQHILDGPTCKSEFDDVELIPISDTEYYKDSSGRVYKEKENGDMIEVGELDDGEVIIW